MKILLTTILTSIACQSLLAQPNIILIVCDDAGYADFGFMNPITGTTTKMLTPELDVLRAQGTLFTKTYTGTVCSPSRGSILSGSYGQRVGYEHNISNHMGANEGPDGFANEDVIAFERMKNIPGANYKTLAIGKWHVGAQDDTLSGGVVTVPGNRPPRQGVDQFFGLLGGSRPYATPMAVNQSSRDEKLLREMSPGVTPSDPAINKNEEDSGNWDGDITDAFGKRAREYVTAHANKSYPFFLYVAFTAPHGPLEESADYAALSNSSHPNYANFTSMSDDRKKYYSMLYTMDRNVGLLMDRIEDPNNDGNTSDSIIDNTIVIFINDNGGATRSNTGLNLPLRGEKGSVYDGGCRVPMFMVGPNIPANASFDKPVHSMDIVPTMIGAGGNTVPAELMGANLIPYVTGADSSDPHEYVLVRGVNKYGLRKGNYKLILEADGDQFLYDTSEDIGESTNIISSNPTILADMLKDAANFDVQVDKPNFPGKGSPLDTYNYNYSFTFNPADNTTTGGVDLILIDYDDGNAGNGVHDSAVNNGGFEENPGAAGVLDYKFDDIPDWENLLGTNTKAIKLDSPANVNGWNASTVDTPNKRHFAIDTDHILTSGESFECSYAWLYLSSSSWASNDEILFQLFTTDTNIIGGTRTIIKEYIASSPTSDNWRVENFTFSYSGATGKRLFLRFQAVDKDGNTGGFARVDNVYLGRLDSGSSQTTPQLWGSSNKWDKSGSAASDTLLQTDSCALGTLVFPAKSDFDYIAENNLSRPTGPEFIQNTLRTEGAGAGGKKATISGNGVLLAKHFLTGEGPTLDLSGNGANYTFDFALDLYLYHDARVEGEGTAKHIVSGEIKDYEHPAALTKNGASKLTFAHDATYTGVTTITAGTVETNAGITLAGSPQVIVQAQGTLGGNGTVSGDVSGAGTISPGQSIGKLTLGGDAQAGTLLIEIDSASADRLDVTGALNAAAMDLTISTLDTPTLDAYIIASYGSLSGAFASVSGLPAGYVIHYAYDDTGNRNRIAIVKESSLDAYEGWVVVQGLIGVTAGFEGDPNADQIPNGIDFLFASDPSSNVRPTYPKVAGNSIFFPTTQAARDYLGTNLVLQTSTDLANWDPVNTSTTITSDHFAPGVDRLSYDVSSLPVLTQRFYRIWLTKP